MTAIQVDNMRKELSLKGYALAEKIFNQSNNQIIEAQHIIEIIIQRLYNRKTRLTYYTQGFALRVLLYKAFIASKDLKSCITQTRAFYCKAYKANQNPIKYINAMKEYRATVTQLQNIALQFQQIKMHKYIY